MDLFDFYSGVGGGILALGKWVFEKLDLRVSNSVHVTTCRPLDLGGMGVGWGSPKPEKLGKKRFSLHRFGVAQPLSEGGVCTMETANRDSP